MPARSSRHYWPGLLGRASAGTTLTSGWPGPAAQRPLHIPPPHHPPAGCAWRLVRRMVVRVHNNTPDLWMVGIAYSQYTRTLCVQPHAGRDWRAAGQLAQHVMPCHVGVASSSAEAAGCMRSSFVAACAATVRPAAPSKPAPLVQGCVLGRGPWAAPPLAAPPAPHPPLPPSNAAPAPWLQYLPGAGEIQKG